MNGRKPSYTNYLTKLRSQVCSLFISLVIYFKMDFVQYVMLIYEENEDILILIESNRS